MFYIFCFVKLTDYIIGDSYLNSKIITCIRHKRDIRHKNFNDSIYIYSVHYGIQKQNKTNKQRTNNNYLQYIQYLHKLKYLHHLMHRSDLMRKSNFKVVILHTRMIEFCSHRLNLDKILEKLIQSKYILERSMSIIKQTIEQNLIFDLILYWRETSSLVHIL